MKYLITRTELKSEGRSTVAIPIPIETNDIELTRKELHQLHDCDRVIFVYEELK